MAGRSGGKEAGIRNPFGKLIGLRIDRVEDGRCLAHLEVNESLHNPNGVLHGGVLFSLADTCMGAALFTLLETHETCATIEIKINFLRPAREGKIECDTEVVRKGRNIAVLESRLSHEGQPVALALGTYSVMPKPGPSSNA